MMIHYFDLFYEGSWPERMKNHLLMAILQKYVHLSEVMAKSFRNVEEGMRLRHEHNGNIMMMIMTDDYGAG